jgi:hypothetical protein
MNATSGFQRRAGARDMLFFQNPTLWPHYPFLPVVRRRLGQAEPELGLLYDARGMSGTFGFTSTVFLSNLFEAPTAEPEFLAQPRCVYDSFDELAADGWTVD